MSTDVSQLSTSPLHRSLIPEACGLKPSLALILSPTIPVTTAVIPPHDPQPEGAETN